jgi:hypothetical protein
MGGQSPFRQAQPAAAPTSLNEPRVRAYLTAGSWFFPPITLSSDPKISQHFAPLPEVWARA